VAVNFDFVFDKAKSSAAEFFAAIMRGAFAVVNTARNARKITYAAVNICLDVSND